MYFSNDEFAQRIDESCAKVLSAKLQHNLVKTEKKEYNTCTVILGKGFPKDI